ncbi:MAG: hypothetical protein JST15_09265 [Bacteroidetes bacterium]|nr:hypothetical protein [Bacteroidota bacterium]
MKKSKIISILKSFSPEELKKFRDFVHSPFHNKNKNALGLFEIIRKYYPGFEESPIEKEKVFRKLFPGKNYNDTVMRILLSDLLKISEEYLAYTGFKKNKYDELKFLLSEYKERNLDSLYKRNFRYAESTLDESGNIDIYYFLKRFELESAGIDFLISKDKQISTGKNVLRQGEYLVSLFLSGILNIVHELKVHKDVLNIEFEFNLADKAIQSIDLEALLGYMKDNNFIYYPVISIYYNMYMSYIHEDIDEYYYELRKKVDENFGYFTRNERVNLMIILENICLIKAVNGKPDFYHNLMEIYRKMLSEKIYLHSDNEYFQINLFRNMFYTAIILEDYKWAEKFLSEHISELSPGQRENMDHYTKAVLFFEKKNFNGSLEEVNKVKFNFFVYKYDVKLLMLKSFYELGYYENALSMIDSFSHFLSKNKIVSETEKERFGNFNSFLKVLIKIKTGSVTSGDKNLSKRISGTKIVNSRKWLLEKAHEAEKRKV